VHKVAPPSAMQSPPTIPASATAPASSDEVAPASFGVTSMPMHATSKSERTPRKIGRLGRAEASSMGQEMAESAPAGQLPSAAAVEYGDAMTPQSSSLALSQALSHLLATLSEDAIFALSTGGAEAALEGLSKRRADAYATRMKGEAIHTMHDQFDAWLVEMTRAVAPIWAPQMLPMGDVIREKVTLELGARGIRSLFSSKPSEKDVARVKRLGTLCVRIVRAIFAADAPLDAEENLNIAAFLSALGLAPEDAAPLLAEAPVGAEQLDIYGDVEPNVQKAILRGAWLAAAWDTIDPKEELVVRTVATKFSFHPPDIEELRKEAIARVEARKNASFAAIDAVRYVLSDAPSVFPSRIAQLMLPKCYRAEGDRWIATESVSLNKKYTSLSSDEKQATLGIAWAAALYSDPSLSRKALLRTRHDRVARDLNAEAAPSRALIEQWMNELLGEYAAELEAK